MLYNHTTYFYPVIPSKEGIQTKLLAQGLFWIPTPSSEGTSFHEDDHRARPPVLQLTSYSLWLLLTPNSLPPTVYVLLLKLSIPPTIKSTASCPMV